MAKLQPANIKATSPRGTAYSFAQRERERKIRNEHVDMPFNTPMEKADYYASFEPDKWWDFLERELPDTARKYLAIKYGYGLPKNQPVTSLEQINVRGAGGEVFYTIDRELGQVFDGEGNKIADFDLETGEPYEAWEVDLDKAPELRDKFDTIMHTPIFEGIEQRDPLAGAADKASSAMDDYWKNVPYRLSGASWVADQEMNQRVDRARQYYIDTQTALRAGQDRPKLEDYDVVPELPDTLHPREQLDFLKKYLAMTAKEQPVHWLTRFDEMEPLYEAIKEKYPNQTFATEIIIDSLIWAAIPAAQASRLRLLALAAKGGSKGRAAQIMARALYPASMAEQIPAKVMSKIINSTLSVARRGSAKVLEGAVRRISDWARKKAGMRFPKITLFQYSKGRAPQWMGDSALGVFSTKIDDVMYQGQKGKIASREVMFADRPLIIHDTPGDKGMAILTKVRRQLENRARKLGLAGQEAIDYVQKGIPEQLKKRGYGGIVAESKGNLTVVPFNADDFTNLKKAYTPRQLRGLKGNVELEQELRGFFEDAIGDAHMAVDPKTVKAAADLDTPEIRDWMDRFEQKSLATSRVKLGLTPAKSLKKTETQLFRELADLVAEGKKLGVPDDEIRRLWKTHEYNVKAASGQPWGESLLEAKGVDMSPVNQKRVIDSIISKLEKVPSLQKVTKELRDQLHRIQAAITGKSFLQEVKLMGDDPLMAVQKRAASALKGKTMEDMIPMDAIKLTPEENKVAFYTIATYSPWDSTPMKKLNAVNGLTLMTKGFAPTNYQMGLLEKVFGQDFVKAILKKLPLEQRALMLLSDIANIPRAVLASMDMSAAGRQLIIGAFDNPSEWWQSFKIMFRTFGSEKNFQRFMTGLTDDPNYHFITAKMGVEIAEPTGIAGGYFAPEYYGSWIAEKIPFVRASERAYISATNKFRYDVASKYISIMPKETTAKEWKDLGKLINWMTGRGSVPHRLEPLIPMLNSAFFAPRLQLARLEWMFGAYTLSPSVRRIWARTTAKFMGAMSGMVGLAVLGGAETSLDPRSSNAYKIKIGNVHLDPWGGFLPYIRTMARVGAEAAGKPGLVTAAGEERYISVVEELFRFFRGKFNPFVGLMVDLAQGETFVGEELTMKAGQRNIFGQFMEQFAPGHGGLANQVRERLTPLYLQDIQDAAILDGWQGAVTSLPGFFGVGLVTYPSQFDKYTEAIKLLPEDMLFPYQQAILEQGEELAWEHLNGKQRSWVKDKAIEIGIYVPEYDTNEYYGAEQTVRDNLEQALYYGREDSDGVWHPGLIEYADKVYKGQMTLEQYIENWNRLKEDYFGSTSLVIDMLRQYVAPIEQKNTELYRNQDKKLEDMVLERYRIMKAHPPTLPNGDIDWDTYFVSLEEFKNQQPPEIKAYLEFDDTPKIEFLPSELQDLHSLIALAGETKETYYDISPFIWKKNEDTGEMEVVYDDIARSVWRYKNPKGDALLNILGLTTVVMTPYAQEIAVDLAAQYGVTITKPRLASSQARRYVKDTKLATPDADRTVATMSSEEIDKIFNDKFGGQSSSEEQPTPEIGDILK